MQGRTPKPARVQQRCPGGGGITLGLTVEKELARRTQSKTEQCEQRLRGKGHPGEHRETKQFRVPRDLCAILGGAWKWPEQPEGSMSRRDLARGVCTSFECQRMGDLEGFGAEKEYEVACCIF